MKQSLSRRIMAGVMASAIMLSMAACGDKAKTESGNTATQTKVEQTAQFNPMAKYDTPVPITVYGVVDSSMKFLKGDTMENNLWTRLYKDELGIDIKYKWIVNADQYEQKLNVSIASNDLADIIPCNRDDKYFTMLNDANKLCDLTDAYDKYATASTKDFMMLDKGVAMESAKLKGKLKALPYTDAPTDGAQVMYIRTDWLKKLGLEAPKTTDEYLNLVKAFAENDPDGNGKKDTYGMGMTKNLLDAIFGLGGFFAAYESYPQKWIKDANGNLQYGSITPQTREALASIQALYKAGYIDKEFGVKDGWKVGEDSAVSKVGLGFGDMWIPLSPLNATIANNPKADWQAFPVPSKDGTGAKLPVNIGVGKYYVVTNGCKNPEAAVKMLNIFIEKCFGKNGEPEKYMIKSPDGVDPFKFAIIQSWPAQKNLDVHRGVMEGLNGNMENVNGNPEIKDAYDRTLRVKEGKGSKDDWGMARVFGEGSSQQVLLGYLNNDKLIYNGFYGAPTQTMASKMTTLTKKELEVFTQIIMGADISEFDKFVDSWNKLGGEQITKEVNEWYKNK